MLDILNSKIISLIDKIDNRNFVNEKLVTSNDIFLKNLNQCFKERTPFYDYEKIEKMDELYSEAFRHSKNSQLERAFEIYKEAELLYNTTIKHTSIENYVNIIRLPIIAYLEFKIKNFNGAIKMLEHSIKIASELEKKEGFHLLHLYKIQQIHNIARVLFSEKQYPEWISLMNDILKYLLNGKMSELKKHSLSGDFSEVDVLTHELMVNQVIYESIKFCDLLKKEELLAKIFYNIDFDHSFCNLTKKIKAYSSWCDLKLKFLSQEIEFMEEFNHIEEKFLNDDMHKLYKYSLLKSISPYLSNDQFLNFLNSLKQKEVC